MSIEYTEEELQQKQREADACNLTRKRGILHTFRSMPPGKYLMCWTEDYLRVQDQLPAHIPDSFNYGEMMAVAKPTDEQKESLKELIYKP